MMVINGAWNFLQLLLSSEVILLAVSHSNSVELVVLRSGLGVKSISMVLVLVRDLEVKL